MHSIKTFWSPELKKERALRKEEAAKHALINDQLKMLRSENQKQAALIQQLEEELRMAHLRNPDADIQHLEALYAEKEHMTKEIYLLRETIKELEMRIETQKQTLAAREESIKKLMEMLQTKGVGNKMIEEERKETERLKTKLFESEARAKHLENILEAKDKDLGRLREVDELRIELNKRDQEILAMNAKMKTLEEQH
ncbi:ELKS/Rab6-interacting/CAST family member 1, partial [Stegodyphus mimosarum]